PVAVEPGYLNEYAGSVTVMLLLFELFAGASSAGTVTVATSLPSAVGVQAANDTTTDPPHGGSDGMICVLVNDSAPVMFSVTGTFVCVSPPLLLTTAVITCGEARPSGSTPYDDTTCTLTSLSGTPAVNRVSGRKLLAMVVVGAAALLWLLERPFTRAVLQATVAVVDSVPVYWPMSKAT